MTTGQPLVDLRAMRLIAEDSDWSLSQCACHYLDHTRQLISSIQHALQGQDFEALRQLALSSAGNSLICGVPGMVEPMRWLETTARRHQFDQCSLAVDYILETFLECEAALGRLDRSA